MGIVEAKGIAKIYNEGKSSEVNALCGVTVNIEEGSGFPSWESQVPGSRRFFILWGLWISIRQVPLHLTGSVLITCGRIKWQISG